jgi:hypothetical protein
MSDTKGSVKRSTTAKIDAEDGFTERVLLSMVFDLEQLDESVKRLKVQVTTLAKEKGVRLPKIV